MLRTPRKMNPLHQFLLQGILILNISKLPSSLKFIVMIPALYRLIIFNTNLGSIGMM